MLVSESGRCQPLKYLSKHRETAPAMLARFHYVDRNGTPSNPELFRWLGTENHRSFRLCEFKVHHPRACRAYAFMTSRGIVIARIEDKTTSNRRVEETIRLVKTMIDEFVRDGEEYE